MNLPKLLIDSHEPNDMILLIEEYPEYFPKIEVKELVVYDEELDDHVQVCDYTNEFDSFALERKVIHTRKVDFDGHYKDGDFHVSLMKKQLQDQLARINMYYEKNKWLLTEGYLINYMVKHPQQASYAYSMVGHCGTMNISFRECYDREDFLLNLYWINRESGSEPFKRQNVKSAEKQVITQFQSLSTIPRVGSKRAKFIFATYPTIMEILENRHELRKINNIGKKTEEAIINWAEEQIEVEIN